VVLSWEFWQRAFAGRQEIVNGAINLDGNQYVVAGIMPAGFSFPIQTPAPDLYLSLAEDTKSEFGLFDSRGAAVLNLIGRLKPGATLAQEQADLQVIASNLAAQYPKDNKQLTRIAIQRELDHLVGDTRPAFRILFGAVMMVLLVGCVNVAGYCWRAHRGGGEKSRCSLPSARDAARSCARS